MRKTIAAMLPAMLLVAASTAPGAQKYKASWDSLNSHQCAEWFKDAKFGIFIHWGPYAVPAYAPLDRNRYAEHFLRSLTAGKEGFAEQLASHHPGKSYFDLAAELTGYDFDADAWAKLFKRAGAKYAVLTSKHHDGFCMWPSARQPYWNSVCIGLHRDVVGEFMKGMRANGLKAGLYYSLCENHKPLYSEATIDKFVADVNLPDLKDIVERYRPDIVWPDGEWDYPVETHRSAEFLAWLLNESPVRDYVIFNDRWGKGRRGTVGDFYTTEYGHNGAKIDAEFYCHPWEECRGIAGSFGYNAYEGPNEYMSDEACIHTLVRTVALGGNLLLNVGPDKEGRIPAIMQDRLFAVGDWLMVNGEAIYGTRYNPRRFEEQGRDGMFVTESSDAVYAIATKWPEKPFVVRDVGPVSSVAFVGSAAKPTFKMQGRDVVVTPPAVSPSNLPCGSAWTFRLRHSEPTALGNSARVFATERRGTVAFAGPVKDVESIKACLASRFPDTKFAFSTSPAGDAAGAALCFSDDVLAGGVPDMLFIAPGAEDGHARSVEGIVRAQRTANQKSDIIVVATPDMPASYRGIASRYNAVTIREDDVCKALASALAKPPAQPECRPLPAALDALCYSRGAVNPLSNIEMNSQWFKGFHYSQPYWQGIPGRVPDELASAPLVWSTTPGDEICLFFRGTAIGFFVVAGPDAGVMKVDIDGYPRGGTVREIDLFPGESAKTHAVVFHLAADELDDTQHRVIVSVSERKNPKSTGHAVRISRIAINGKILNYYQNAVADPALPAESATP